MKLSLSSVSVLLAGSSALAAASEKTRVLNEICEDSVVFFHNCAEDAPFLAGSNTRGYYSGREIGGDYGGFLLQSDFQSHRWGYGYFEYEVDGLVDGREYVVTMGFAEVYGPNCNEGQRVIDVTVNGEEFASDLDIFSEVGCNNALVIKKKFRLSGLDKFYLSFFSSVENPMVSIIKVSEACADEEVTCPCFNEDDLDPSLLDGAFVTSDRLSIRSVGDSSFSLDFSPDGTGKCESTSGEKHELSQQELVVCEEIMATATKAVLVDGISDLYSAGRVGDTCPCSLSPPAGASFDFCDFVEQAETTYAGVTYSGDSKYVATGATNECGYNPTMQVERAEAANCQISMIEQCIGIVDSLFL